MSDFLSLVLYLSVFLLSALLFGYGSKTKGRHFFTIVSILLLTVLSAIRFEVGTDYVAYVNGYTVLSNMGLTEYISTYSGVYEVGAYIIAQIANLFPYSITVFFGIFSLLTISVMYVALKKYNVPYLWLAMLLYVFVLLPTSFNGVRQMLAVSIFVYATTFIFNRSMWKYVILVVIAAAFHKTALLLLPLYLIGIIFHKDKAIKVRSVVIMFIILGSLALVSTGLLSLLTDLSLFEKYGTYQVSRESSSGLFLLLKAIVMAVALLFYRYISKYPYVAFCIAMSFIELAVLYMFRNSVDLVRFALYFTPFSLIIISLIPKSFETGGRVLSFICISLYAMLLFYISFYLLGGSEIFPYQYQLSLSGVM